MATSNKHVLITGGAGLIGRILINRLQMHYTLTSFDLQAAPGIPSLVGNLTDFPAVLHACQGQDTIVHLAADPRVDSPWESNLSTNILGTYHVFEAARQANVPRVVVASSQHATGGFYLDEPYKAITEGRYEDVPPTYPLLDETCPIRPDGYYGTAKAFGEALGSYYWDYHRLTLLHLRIGWVLATEDPTFSALALILWCRTGTSLRLSDGVSRRRHRWAMTSFMPPRTTGGKSGRLHERNSGWATGRRTVQGTR